MEVCTPGQAEQTKYEVRIVGLQRAKQEAAAKAEAQSQKATLLQQDLDRLTTERARFVHDFDIFHAEDPDHAEYTPGPSLWGECACTLV